MRYFPGQGDPFTVDARGERMARLSGYGDVLPHDPAYMAVTYLKDCVQYVELREAIPALRERVETGSIPVSRKEHLPFDLPDWLKPVAGSSGNRTWVVYRYQPHI